MVRAIRDLQHAFHRRGRERRLRQCRITVEALEERTRALSYEARARGLARRANLGADNSNGGHAPRAARPTSPENRPHWSAQFFDGRLSISRGIMTLRGSSIKE